MSKFAIYRKDGGILRESKTAHNSDGQQVYASNLEYNGTWMGECFLSVKVTSAYPIDFHVGDYIMYRGEKFVLGNDPSTVKKARRGTYGEGFTYDNIKFSALQLELTDIRFLDLVIGDNELHYTSLPDFPFFAASIDDYCDRLQANTNRWCAANGISEADYWLFITPSLTKTTQRCNGVDGLAAVAEERYNEAYGGGSSSSSSSSDDGSAFALDDEKKDVYVTVSNQSVWDALSAIKNDFGLNFIIRGRNVIIGSAGIPTNHIFEYGKGNGLSEIERTADDDQQIITRLYAYGSEKNLPIRYYANMNTKGYLLITGDYHAGSTANGISVSLENVPFGRGMFVDMESDDNSTVVWYAVKCMVGNVEFLANIEATNTEGGTARLLAFSATAGTGVTFTVNRTTQENIDAVKSAIDGGADRVTFLGGVNIDKFPGDRKYALTENMPNNMAVNKLMLPGFPNQSLYDWVIANGGTALDSAIGKAAWHGYTAIFSKEKLRPYIQSVNASLIGIREGVKVFDGSDDTNEIYPTIENTNSDTIYDAETVHDNGIFGDGDNEPTVTLILPSFGSGFDLKEQCALGDNPTIAMKSGFCGGREFAIDTDSNGKHRVKKVQTDKWEVVCKREFDSLLQLYFPYSYSASTGSSSSSSDDGSDPYQVESGDKYVLTGIPMTDTYIAAASKTLLEAALLFLSKNDYTRYTYLPKIDELFMAREHDDAGSSSLYMTIKEGDLLRFQDAADLLISNSMIFIDTLRIKENGNNGIPTYDVTLRNDKEVGSIQRMQEQINSITGSGVNITGGGGGSGAGYNLNQLDSIIDGTGKKLFLSKVKDDTAQGLIGFVKGLWVKAKNLFGIDANGNAKLNNITASQLIANVLKTPGFAEAAGMIGNGFGVTMRQDGTAMLQTDDLLVLGRMLVNSLNIREVTYIGGVYLLTPAGSTVAAVLPIYGESADTADTRFWTTDSDNLSNPVEVGYRLLWLADDGTTATMNFWQQGDQAYSQTFNIKAGEHENVTNSLWWRLVVGVGTDDDPLGDGKEYHYADVADTDIVLLFDSEGEPVTGDGGSLSFIGKGSSYAYVSNGLTHYTVPTVGDKAVCLGSQTSSNRRGAIQLNTEGVASIGIYDGINNYAPLSTHEVHFFSKDAVRMSSRRFRWTTATGASTPPIIYRGDWAPVNGVNPTSYYYDEWDYQGSRWLCRYQGAEGTTEAPGATPANWKEISLKGDAGTGYKLLPNPNIIKTKQTGENTYDPATASLTCGYVKNEGGTITSVANATALIDNRYAIYFRRKSRGGDYESKYWFYADSKARAFLSSISLSGYDAVEFYLAENSLTPSLDIVTRATFLNSLSGVIDNIIVPVVSDGSDGTSPIVAGITNQMTSVACDKDGNVAGSSDKSLTTTVRMYNGSTLQTGGFTSITCKINGTTLGTDYVNENTPRKYYKVSLDTENNSLTGGVTITVKSGTNIDGKAEVEIVVVMSIDGTAVTRTVTFVINGVRAGADGEPVTLYELLPSKDAISFGSGTTSQNMYMELLKIVGDSANTIARNYAESSHIYVLYGTTNVPDEDDAKKLIDNIGNKHSDVQKWGVDNDSEDSTLTFGGANNNTATILSTATFTQIYLALYRKVTAGGTTSYVLLDRETIPVIKDGQDGDDGLDAWTLTVNPSPIIIEQDIETPSSFGLPINISFIAKCGDNTATVGTIGSGDVSNNLGLTISRVTTGTDYNNGVRLQITGYNKNSQTGRYATNGYITCTIPLSYGSGTTARSTSMAVRIQVGVNLLGEWETKIVGDAETSVATKLTNAVIDGEINTFQQVGTYIRSASENTAKLTETVTNNSIANEKNLFGFTRNISYDGAVPFVQGYGFVATYNNSQQYGRIYNIKLNDGAGYYVVSCEIKAQHEANIRFFLADIPPEKGSGLIKVGDELKVAVTTQWKKIVAVYNLTAADVANSNGQLVIRDGSTSNYVFIRYLQIERGSTPSLFGICADDAANNSEPMHVTWNQSPSGGMFSDETSGNYGPGGTSKYTTNRVYPSRSPQYPEDTGYIELIKDDLVMTEGIYTLSFWARASVNESVMECFCYDATNTETYKGVVAYCDGLDMYYGEIDPNQTEGMSYWGSTRIKLTTAWKKYYVHWYMTGASSKIHVIPIRINGADTGGAQIDYYIAQIKLERGYVTSANRTVYETVMKQTARRMDFSVLVNSMEKAGIHLYTANNATPEVEDEIAEGIIDIVAGKVRFVDPNGNPYASPKVAINPTTGVFETVDARLSGNLYTPYKRLTSSNISSYRLTNFAGETVVNLSSTGLNLQVEVAVELSLPKITADMLGCEVNIFNATTSMLTITGSGNTTSSSPDKYCANLIIPSTASNLGTNGSVGLQKYREAKFKAVYTGYSSIQQYAWLCCFANINP